MPNIKRLNLDRWQEDYPYDEFGDLEESMDKYLVPIEPKLNRTGRFKFGSVVWFENQYGAWVEKSSTDFDFKIKVLSHKQLRRDEEKAIRFLIGSGALDKKIRQHFMEKLSIQDHLELLRRIKFNFIRRALK